MVIDLKPIDLATATLHAGVIQGVKSVRYKRGEIPNNRICNQSDFAIAYTGMLGEVAVSRVLGTAVNAEVLVAGDGGIDMEMDGQTIQVKTSSHPQARYLVFNDEKDFATDWAISCAVQWPASVEIKGFIGRERFLKVAEWKDLGFGMRLVVANDQLTPIEQFAEAVEWKRGG